MESYDEFLKEIQYSVDQLKGLHDIAYRQYSGLVASVLADQIWEEHQIERILDGILDFAGDERFQELSKKLCRHIYNRYPQLVMDYVTMFRQMYEDTEDADEICNS